MNRRTLTWRSHRRRGVLTLEAVLVLPILILMLLAILQFGILMVVEQTITHAAAVGAREAAKGADVDAVTASVEEVLGLHGIQAGSAMTVIVEDPLGNDPVVARGELDCDAPASPEVDPGMVRVSVCVDLSRRPFLNALRTWAIDFTGRQFRVSSLAPREFSGEPESTRRPECGCG